MARGILKSYTIEDSLAEQGTGAIEVTVILTTGEHRWCYFMTLAALANCGDWISGTQVRFHYGSEHMVVVATQLTNQLIEAALRTLDEQGSLLASTRAFG